MVPNAARKTAAARIRAAGQAVAAAEAARDAALLQLRSLAPGQVAYLTNQVINAPGPPSRLPGASSRKRQGRGGPPGPDPAQHARPEHGPPERREQADHPRHPDGRIQRRNHPGPSPGMPLRPAGDEAYALIRESLTVSATGELLARLDPLTRPRRTRALAALCHQLNNAASRYQALISSCATRSNATLALHEIPLYLRSPRH